MSNTLSHRLFFNTVSALKAGITAALTASVALGSGCVWKPDLAATQLNQWELPTSRYVEVSDAKVHVAESALCHSVAAKGSNMSSATSAANANNGSTLLRHPSTDNSQFDHTQANSIKSSSSQSIPAQAATTGDGVETLVLIHGTSASLHTWNGWTRELENDYCVVRLDLPAFGLTGPYTEPSKRYSMDNYVTTVVEVMDKINIDKAIIAGNSLGGGVAWLTTLQHPQRINRLILVDSMGFKFEPKHIPVGFKLAQYPILDPIVAKVLPKSLVRKSIESVYVDDSKISDDLVTRYFELTRREGNRQALTQRMREGIVMNEVSELGRIKQPTLIMWGKQDDLIPVDSAYKFKQAIPNSKLVVFDNLGHVPHEEDPKATAAVVKQFLQ